MKLVLGADHGGFDLKENIKEYLKEQGIEFTDYGTLTGERCDYPDIAKKVAEAVADGTFDRGILVCGTGIGIGIDRLVMLMTGKTYIQEVLFFPQMKPEKKMPQSTIKEWEAIGVSENWAYVLRKAGFNLISDIRSEKAQGLQQKIGEINKKYKLGYETPTVDDIQQWIDKANV